MMERMRELIDKLNEYAYRYYTLDEPIVSDKEYDILYDELETLESQTGIRESDSPTNRVGSELSKGFDQYAHKEKLYSLSKSQSMQELEAWYNKNAVHNGSPIKCSVEYKFDGLTMSLSYNNGELIRATTRGNGSVGEIVTNQAKTIRTIPLTIGYKGEIDIQGECIMRLSELNKFNATHETPLKNARNAASGALRNLNPIVTRERHLDFMAYNIGYSPEKAFVSQQDIVEFLSNNKFRTRDYFKIVNSFTELKDCVDEIGKNRSKLDFLIDGAVIKIDNINIRQELGATVKAPRWAIAFKYEAEEISTIVKDVLWQVSRTGKVNPLAVLESVELAGATISRATLNNLEDIKRKDIKINSRVFIRRSNDVIPEILGVAEHYDNSVDIIPPEYCPSCNTRLIRDGAFVYCPNKTSCGAINISKMEHFVSKDAMDIEGLSERTIEQLFGLGYLKNIDDIYGLSESVLLTAEGFKDKKANNIISAIERSKTVILPKFIYALGISNIGKKSAIQLAERYKTLENLLNCTYDELILLEDFGDIMANDVNKFFHTPNNIELIERLIKKGVSVTPMQEYSGVFEGYNVCFTGAMMTARSKAKDMVIANGGSVSESVSKNVNLVVAGEDAGSKLAKAEKLGIKIIEEKAFIEMIDGNLTE